MPLGFEADPPCRTVVWVPREIQAARPASSSHQLTTRQLLPTLSEHIHRRVGPRRKTAHESVGVGGGGTREAAGLGVRCGAVVDRKREGVGPTGEDREGGGDRVETRHASRSPPHLTTSFSFDQGCGSIAMASGTDEKAKMESLTSAAAFVEGGIQDACDDACSICLEAFCESDPSALTSCKHEFHLQCILECQELLEAVERERNIRTNQTRNTTIFHHPALGDFELQHLPVVGNDAELEERILQHLAAAAAMGRAHHLGRRDGHRGRSGSHGRPQFLVFSTHPNSPTAGGTISSSSAHMEGDNDSNPATPRASESSPRAIRIGDAGCVRWQS
nr:unnamed protein product [Digitaria exilis]